MVLAQMARLGIPLGFALGRSVSALATAATMAMLYAVGSRDGGRSCGLLAACLYAALFRFCGAWYDLVRTDSLSMALVLGSALVGYRARHVKGATLAAILLVAAFFAKQTAAVFAGPMALCLLWRNRRLGIAFCGFITVLGVGSVYAYDRATGGWSWFYVFQGHQGHRFLWENFRLEYWRDVLFLAPMLLLFPILSCSYGVYTRWFAGAFAVFLAVAFAQRAGTLNYPEHMYYRELWYESPRVLILVPPLVMAGVLGAARVVSSPREPVPSYWLAMFGAGALASALNHSSQWSYANCFMPISVFGSIAVALTIQSYVATNGIGAILVPTAGIVQLLALVYDPRAQVPSAADRDALTLLDRRVSAMEGPLFIPAHPFLSFRKTGDVHVHQMSISDIAFNTGVPDLGPSLVRGRWHTAIVDENLTVPGLDGPMYLSDRLPYAGNELYPRTGFQSRPLSIWRLQSTTERALAPGISGNFEAGVYEGWTETGGAFRTGPMTRVQLEGLSGLQGDRAASSRGSACKGMLESDSFVVETPRISVLVAGNLGGTFACCATRTRLHASSPRTPRRSRPKPRRRSRRRGACAASGRGRRRRERGREARRDRRGRFSVCFCRGVTAVVRWCRGARVSPRSVIRGLRPCQSLDRPLQATIRDLRKNACLDARLESRHCVLHGVRHILIRVHHQISGIDVGCEHLGRDVCTEVRHDTVDVP